MVNLTSSERLSVSSLREQAHRMIRTAVVTGEIRPGRIYSALQLAAQLGVSVTPVREAMLELVREGLLEPVRNRGYRVVELADADIAEIYEIRELLEVPALIRVAGRVPEAEVPRLRELVTTMQRAADQGDLPTFLEADRDFHLTLLAMAGNRRLVELVGLLRDQTRLYGAGQLAQGGGLRESADQHAGLLDALLAGDSDRARELMHEHLVYTHDVLTPDA
ncbi:DNA-binding transcriptional regulator, GntR family [Streptoalloteichus tenebrarius]|uniref:DNA-binding transcriptional regulator, GntR family n=1 Tax=Streptoalloteichus tenebrarius (strain ATCC 17920 / DSM 40477 / JCM 4838 / CBS 697.72 / NBRC 16177 / NCIMB 11028 / NRRL B-12390 / A12253. 1 / ISP 5477) TaxID=1933 RepID=A0ABT1HS14_STRSD|nr:GntR family transcriptional regulator [Streptoalloteichus tenebrarius]MCP2258292.1 DNA-binding transcriptional regulator, GntR family [Streptoalloteichus tenebrarius]